MKHLSELQYQLCQILASSNHPLYPSDIVRLSNGLFSIQTIFNHTKALEDYSFAVGVPDDAVQENGLRRRSWHLTDAGAVVMLAEKNYRDAVGSLFA